MSQTEEYSLEDGFKKHLNFVHQTIKMGETYKGKKKKKERKHHEITQVNCEELGFWQEVKVFLF